MPPGHTCSSPCFGTQWPWKAASPRPTHMSPFALPPASTARVSPGENGGSSVLECALLAWLAGIGSAATPRSRGTWGEPWGDCTGTGTWGRLGPAALALARGAASLQKPVRSKYRSWRDTKGSPPPTHCLLRPLCPGRVSSLPVCAVSAASSASLSPPSPSGSRLWRLAAAKEEGLLQSPPCHPQSSWVKVAEGMPAPVSPSDPQERYRKR